MRSSKVAFCIFFIGSVLALSSAYIMEYVFGILPCQICTYQRLMYFCAIAFSLLSLIFHKKILVWLMVGSYCANAAIALCQVAIEQHWIKNIFSCGSAVNLQSMTDAEIFEYTMNQHVTSCEVPALVALGVSVAGWNMIYCVLVLALYLYCKKRYEVSYRRQAAS